MTSAFVFLYLLQESELDLLGKEDNDTDIEQYIITWKGAVIPQLLLSLNVVDVWGCSQNLSGNKCDAQGKRVDLNGLNKLLRVQLQVSSYVKIVWACFCVWLLSPTDPSWLGSNNETVHPREDHGQGCISLLNFIVTRNVLLRIGIVNNGVCAAYLFCRSPFLCFLYFFLFLRWSGSVFNDNYIFFLLNNQFNSVI